METHSNSQNRMTYLAKYPKESNRCVMAQSLSIGR